MVLLVSHHLVEISLHFLHNELSCQVPTFRADPLNPKCDTWCEFPVSDRPNAVAQFFKAADADPDLIKVSPRGRPGRAFPSSAATFYNLEHFMGLASNVMRLQAWFVKAQTASGSIRLDLSDLPALL